MRVDGRRCNTETSSPKVYGNLCRKLFAPADETCVVSVAAYHTEDKRYSRMRPDVR
jgi:hypothetical protein